MSSIQYNYMHNIIKCLKLYSVIEEVYNRLPRLRCRRLMDLRKPGFHTHNSKIHVSPSHNICTHQQAFQAGISAESYQGAFAVACF